MFCMFSQCGLTVVKIPQQGYTWEASMFFILLLSAICFPNNVSTCIHAYADGKTFTET